MTFFYTSRIFNKLSLSLSTAGGPYLISCGDYDTKLYLKAHPESKILIVTHNKNMADAFTVKTVSETKLNHELEFSLTSSLSKSKKIVGNRGDDAIVPLDYILDIPVNPLTGNGFQTNKPRMRLNSEYQRTRLLLKKRTDNRISCDTKEWIKGREAYYIQCIRRMHSGFLCVKMRKSYNKTKTQKATDQDLNAGDRGCDNTEQQHEDAEEQTPAFDETPRNQGGATVSSIEGQPSSQPVDSQQPTDQKVGSQDSTQQSFNTVKAFWNARGEPIDHQDSQRPTDQKSKKDIGPGGATVSSVEGKPGLQLIDHQDSQQPTDQKSKKDIGPGGATVSPIEEKPIDHQDSQQPTDQKSKKDIGPGGATVSSVERKPVLKPIGGQDTKRSTDQISKRDNEPVSQKEMMDKYKVCVKSSPTSHDDERKVFMLFRLQPIHIEKKKKQPTKNNLLHIEISKTFE